MKKLMIIITLFAFASPVYATRQIPDEIEYKGKRYVMVEVPLGDYIKDNNIDLMIHFKARCSANWRGYEGHWVVENGTLYLSKLFSDACNPKPMSLKIVFPDSEVRVKADWFTGTLSLYKGGTLWSGKEPLVKLKFVRGKLEE